MKKVIRKKKKTTRSDFSRLEQAVENITLTGDKKKAYFKELYALFKKAKWRRLPLVDKVGFFRNWFIAISDEYIKAYAQWEVLNEYNQSKIRESREASKKERSRDRYVEGLQLTYEMNRAENALKGKFGMPCDKDGRQTFLKDIWTRNKASKKDTHPFSYSPALQFPPIWETSPEEATSIKELLEPFKSILKDDNFPVIGALKLCYINVQYPDEVIIENLSKIVKSARKTYSRQFPKGLQIKNQNPFEAWEQYLTIYMLNRSGISQRELAEQVYSERQADPIRQIARAVAKAKKLSQNALTTNFPDKYQ